MSSVKPSATALLIARSQILLARQPCFSHLFEQEAVNWYQLFVRSAGYSISEKKAYIDWEYLKAKILECFSIPGIYLHYTLRKKLIRDIVEDRLNQHQNTQLVVLAVGFDPLCVLLARRYPQALCWELDLPATQKYKKNAIERENIQNLKFISVDLRREKLTEALLGAGFDSTKPTIFLAEGISMYLKQAEVRNLLQSFADLTSRAMLIFTFMEALKPGFIQFHNASFLVDIWLALKREPFRWGASRKELQLLVNEAGWELETVLDHRDLRQKYLNQSELAGSKLAIGECIAVANNSSRV